MSADSEVTATDRRGSVAEQYYREKHVNNGTNGDGIPSPVTNPTMYPNRWARFRHRIREPFAEFLGTGLLVLFGTAVNCQVGTSSNESVSSTPAGNWTSMTLGWGVGLALGVWVALGVSKGHINPAVTLAQAVFRGFPWRKVPEYMIAQVLGAMFAALIVYGNYINAINIVEGGSTIRTVPGTAAFFGTYPLQYMTNASCFFDEFIGTAILLLVISALSDPARAYPVNPATIPVALFFTLMGICAAFGNQTGFAINPARDLGPRIATAMVGYGRGVFNYRNQYWLWCPIIASFAGGLFGTFLYDAFIFTGDNNIFNRPYAINYGGSRVGLLSKFRNRGRDRASTVDSSSVNTAPDATGTNAV